LPAPGTRHRRSDRGEAISNHSFKGLGAPGDVERRATIRPIPDEGFDGRHYFAEDWHVIVLADIAKDTSKAFTRRDFEQVTAGDEIVFTLDGKALKTSRSATRRLVLPDDSEDERGGRFLLTQVSRP
jgi:hypothetical protein